VVLDGLGGDEQPFADLRVGIALGDQLEDLVLAGGEPRPGAVVTFIDPPKSLTRPFMLFSMPTFPSRLSTSSS
jgi:hypothetical protein